MAFSIDQLPPAMKKQALAKIALEDSRKNKLLDSEDDEPKRSKYGAKKQEVQLLDGTMYTFDSVKEARVYKDLEIRLRAGEISNLQLQVPYVLVPSQKLSNGKTERASKYIADFVYEEDGKTKVVDAKGFRTDIYKLKRKLMLYVHGIEIIEM